MAQTSKRQHVNNDTSQFQQACHVPVQTHFTEDASSHTIFAISAFTTTKVADSYKNVSEGATFRIATSVRVFHGFRD